MIRVLVSAASRHGSTDEIARAISVVLRAFELDVDVIAPDDVDSVSSYDAVIIGSAVYDGHWLRPAIDIVERHRDDLRLRPVFLFSSGPLGDRPRLARRAPEATACESDAVAMDHRVFAGSLARRRLGLSERIDSRVHGIQDGDFRPWDDIVDWARAIARYLRAESTAAIPTR